MSVTEDLRLKKKEDRDNNFSSEYETYYEYELTWEFVNVNSEQKYRFESETESTTKNSYKVGDKKTIFVYYNGDEADFELADPFGAVIFLAAGTILIIIAIVDIVSIKKRAGKTAVKGSGKARRS